MKSEIDVEIYAFLSCIACCHCCCSLVNTIFSSSFHFTIFLWSLIIFHYRFFTRSAMESVCGCIFWCICHPFTANDNRIWFFLSLVATHIFSYFSPFRIQTVRKGTVHKALYWIADGFVMNNKNEHRPICIYLLLPSKWCFISLSLMAHYNVFGLVLGKIEPRTRAPRTYIKSMWWFLTIIMMMVEILRH